ncbi:unnamed protein product [Phytophthora fragariaefolia]|uniref:Unnamed protein product n=1 Tax=Phytophthora fragariaefolia TaxID=1490495 RepID=A0A9W6Y7A7_9STRA|nr:unnamed protein product [Phytophthora fragariaefolia]
MDIDCAEAILRATVDKDFVEVTRREVAEWAKHMGNCAIKRGGGVLQALGHDDPLPEYTTGISDGRERNVTLAHLYLVEAIGQVNGTEDDAARHGAQYHVLERNRGLGWDGGIDPVFTPPRSSMISSTYSYGFTFFSLAVSGFDARLSRISLTMDKNLLSVENPIHIMLNSWMMLV